MWGQTPSVSVSFADAGTHTLRWVFKKDDYNEEDYTDCAWISGFVWTPTAAPADVPVDMGGGKAVAVPQAWIDAHPALVAAAGGDAAAALQATAANGRMSVVECYVLGLDPEDATNDFKITSFSMKADGTPDLESLEFAPAQSEWNVPGARPVVKGAAALGGEWKAVEEATAAEKAAMRFFKVVVELP